MFSFPKHAHISFLKSTFHIKSNHYALYVFSWIGSDSFPIAFHVLAKHTERIPEKLTKYLYRHSTSVKCIYTEFVTLISFLRTRSIPGKSMKDFSYVSHMRSQYEWGRKYSFQMIAAFNYIVEVNRYNLKCKIDTYIHTQICVVLQRKIIFMLQLYISLKYSSK